MAENGGRPRRKYVTVVAVLVTLLAGCATSQDRLGENGAQVTAANRSIDGIMLVFVREFSFASRVDDIKSEKTMLDCVQRAIVAVRRNQKFVSFDNFRRAVFPDMPRESVPHHPEFFADLMVSSQFRDAIAPLNLSYVVFVGGVIETGEPDGVMLCDVPDAPPGCYGYLEWDRASHMAASVLDLRGPLVAQSVEADATGTAWLAMIAIFPLGVPSEPSTVACRTLGHDIALYLDRKTPDR